MKIPLDWIDPDAQQPRRHFAGIQELADSIMQVGLQQPITVRPYKGRYIIIAGERRWRAAKLAGLEEIDIIVRQCDETEAFQLSVVENVQRADLTPLEEAEAFQRLQQEGMTQAEIGRLVGKGQSHIAQKLRLLKAPEPITYYLRNGLVTENHVRQVLRLKDIYGERLESSLLREGCGELAGMVQPSDVGLFLYLLRPEDVPCAIFCNASEEVTRAASWFLEYVSKHTGPLPQWVVAGFWWLSVVVRCEMSVAHLTTNINAWKERYECALVFWNCCGDIAKPERLYFPVAVFGSSVKMKCGERTNQSIFGDDELYWTVYADLKQSASLDRDVYEIVPQFSTVDEMDGWIGRMILPSRFQNAAILERAFVPAATDEPTRITAEALAN